MKLKWQKQVAALGLGAAMLVGLLSTSMAQSAPTVGDAVIVPAVTLIDGQKLPAGYFQGKPLIVEYWASWCPFCGRQNPRLQKLTLEAQKTGLQILTVSVDRKESDAKDYIQEHHYTFPVAMETPELLKVFGRRDVIPEIFVVAADGKLAEVLSGELPEEQLAGLIKYAPGAR
ncbi:MAG: TlpA disulfide reductase family protein [Burkholderiaceae bacterium]